MLLALTLVLVLTLDLAQITKPPFVYHENGHETEFYKAKERINKMILRRNARRSQLE